MQVHDTIGIFVCYIRQLPLHAQRDAQFLLALTHDALFVKFSPQEYYYQGIFELVGYKYEDEKDEDGNIRKEYKFRLRKVTGA